MLYTTSKRLASQSASASAPAAQQPARRRNVRCARCCATADSGSAAPSSSQPGSSWLRPLAAAGAAACIVLSPLAPQAALAAGQAGVSPWDEGKRIQLGPTADGRVRGCSINPNCVSSANLDDLYGPPWRAADDRAAAAAAVLEAAVPAAVPGAELARAFTLQDGAEYRAWTVSSLFGDDVMEFVLRPEARSSGSSSSGRGSSSNSGGVLVTYRSQAGSVKFLYPFQTPISDGGTQKKRLDALRRELGWPIVGCSYLECYE